MSEKHQQELIAKKQMQEFIRQEVERQTRGILKKKEASEDIELLPGPQDDLHDSGVVDLEHVDTPAADAQETAVLLDKTALAQHSQQVKTRLQNTNDSLLDIRLENMRRDEPRRCLPNLRGLQLGRNRGELYCCYAIYFFLLFWVFVFAVFHVWLPILKGIKEGRHYNGTRQFHNPKYNH